MVDIARPVFHSLILRWKRLLAVPGYRDTIDKGQGEILNIDIPDILLGIDLDSWRAGHVHAGFSSVGKPAVTVQRDACWSKLNYGAALITQSNVAFINQPDTR